MLLAKSTNHRQLIISLIDADIFSQCFCALLMLSLLDWFLLLCYVKFIFISTTLFLICFLSHVLNARQGQHNEYRKSEELIRLRRSKSILLWSTCWIINEQFIGSKQANESILHCSNRPWAMRMMTSRPRDKIWWMNVLKKYLCANMLNINMIWSY